MQIFKLFSLSILLSLGLSGCVHINTPQENIASINDGSMALVISGCEFKYKTTNLIMSDTEEKSYCTTYWKAIAQNDASTTSKDNKSQEYSISLNGYTTMEFIKPGTYEFTGFSGYINYETSLVYHRKADTPSIFTNFTVKGGDVVYVGDFALNTIHTKRVLQAIKPVYYKLSYIKEYLTRHNYASLTDKLEGREVELKPEFEFVRDYMPLLEEDD